jgi:hypothetical protein
MIINLDLKIIFLVSISFTIIVNLVVVQPNNNVLAISFDRQEIYDDRNDWIFWPATKEKQEITSKDGKVISIGTAVTSSDATQCNLMNPILPEIYSVSYGGTNDRLNATIWTSDMLLESFLLRNSINENNLHIDSPLPLWNRVKYTMVLDIFSTFDRGIDYRIDFVGDRINSSHTQWKKETYEISADGINKLILNESYNRFPFGNKQFIEFSLDLKRFGDPDEYRMLFYITDQYIQNGKLCRIVDSTNWVLSSPPRFDILKSMDSISMRPGEEEDIIVTIDGSTDLESKAKLYVNNTDMKLAETTFLSNETIVSSVANGTSVLHIGIPPELKLDQPKHLVMPLNVNISFLPNITNRDGETFSNNQSISLLESSSVALTLLPPLTWSETLEEYAKILRPIGELWQIFAAIGTAIIIIVLYFIKRRRRDNKTLLEK